MVEQVFELKRVRERCTKALRDRGAPMKLGEIVVATGLPHYAVARGLETALMDRKLVFEEGVGWTVPAVAAEAQGA